VYTGFLRRLLKNIGVSFDELDLNSDIPSLEAYDPNVHIKRLNQEFNHLESRLQEDIRRADYASFQMIKGIDHFRVGVQEFIDQFGHLSDSGNDFSVSPWRENPDLILRLILDYHRVESQQGQKLRFQDISQSFLRRYMLKVIYDRALKFRYYRERVSSIYTYGYGLFREYYMALGDQLVERRCLDRSFDIFYLYDREVRQLLENDSPELNVSELVKLRKDEMDSYRDIELPEIVYGDQAPPIIQNESEQLRGTPTSGGVYTGRAKVIQGIHDFSKLEDGNVLVIPYSDVGWTPLFARAGAVVAESGGMLSHSSIVAREYGIPAVVSVPGACKIQDDFLVTVDGYRGVVMVQSV
jgi:phosphohistidine swiveling domain-containing protein